MNKILLLICFVSSCVFLSAQYPGGVKGGRRGGANLTIGHFYGKIVDSKNKGVGGVTVQLIGKKFDTITNEWKQVIVKTDITENNGDFSLEGISIMGRFTLRATSVGYKKLETPVAFGIKMPTPGAAPDMQAILEKADKDLGNIKLENDETQLAEVTVTAKKQLMEMGIDRKTFNVDQNLSSAGQTATEVMKSIPSVSVDIDGNVTLRNASPTIFVDGRPTTLTLDQIPADIIDKVEIITNPSAKYDASGGNAGILNIILKKNKRNGYNGNVRLGVDARGKINSGADINYRQGKINFNASANYNQRKSIITSNTNTAYYDADSTQVISNTDGNNNGHFQFYRGGVDYFIDNRNTISSAVNYAHGQFHSISNQSIDTNQLHSFVSTSKRVTNTDADFENFGGQLSFKHNFTKEGHDITADLNYNSSTNSSIADIVSQTNNASGTQLYPLYKQQSNGSGYNHYFTIQSDYENKINDDSKVEAGLRAAIREFKTDNLQYVDRTFIKDTFLLSPYASSKYKFNDQVYAAYVNYSFKVNKWGFQLGVRAESSNYSGRLYTLSGADSTPVNVTYPLSLFPSSFITYKVDDQQDIQINYSRRINRPSFFQLLPSYDFTDPQNPSVGNPNLKPEFTNSLEWNYNNNYKANSNFLASVYFKYSTDLITKYLYKDIDKNLPPNASTIDSLYYTSYINANNSYTYGLELTNKMPIVKWWDLLLNLNFYDSKINATIPGQSVSNDLVTWFAKMNSTFKIMKGLSLQITSESRSKSLIPQNNNYGGGGGGRGMNLFGGMQTTLAQGYILPRYFDVDVSIKKDWNWKKGRTASLTMSINDIFKSGTKTHTDATYFTQETARYRDPQLFRVNFNYRFGKIDVSLFKRKNTKADRGMDSGGGDN